MSITLTESSRSGRRQTSWTVVSVVAHVIVLGVLVANQGMSAGVKVSRPEQRNLLFPQVPPAPQTQPPTSSTSPDAFALPSVPSVPVLNALDIVLPGLPDVVTGDPVFDASAWERRAFAATPPGRSSFGTDSALAIPDRRGVDRQVEPRAGNPVPRYPPMLAANAIGGSVTVRFVVDTLGRVDARSVQVLRATHRLFDIAVRDALVRMRFVPAELRGGKTPQLVEQSFQFEIRR